MRIAFLLHELGGAGGMGVVVGHARRLGAEIVLTGGGSGTLDGVTVRSLDEARDIAIEYDVALATWWETAPALWELRARSRAVFLQSLEERFYREDEVWERYGAASVLGLPVHFVTIGDWLQDVVSELRPDALCPVVRNGIDKTVFAPMKRTARSRFFHVLVEGQPDLWFKAVPEAIAAARAAGDDVRVTLVAPEPEHVGDLGADIVTGRLDAHGMANLYAEHDVLLKLSRVEGVALAPIEAMHVGLPCVTTPVTGHDEYVRHEKNALVVGFDEPGAATAAVTRLANDRDLLHKLSEGALATAAGWPSIDESSTAMGAALEQIAAAPPLDPAPAFALAAARRRFGIERGRAFRAELEWKTEALAGSQVMVEELWDYVRKAEGQRDEAYRALDAVRSRAAYKAAVKMRDAVKRVKGG
jgi:glycosyltransferase involved in cell wall biosynthesis